MSCYALTYPQLMNQAISAELADAEVARLSQGHDFARVLSDGVYRAPGVPLLTHLTRTASILLSVQQPLTIVLGGLLHATYIMHLFDGSARQQPRSAHRKRIRDTFGEELDTLIWEYDRVPWYSTENVRQHVTAFDELPALWRQALTIRLANDLEDSLDRALDYSSATRRGRRTDEYVSLSVVLAEKLNVPGIARELAESIADREEAALPDAVVADRDSAYEMPVKRLWQASPLERAAVSVYRRLKKLKIRP